MYASSAATSGMGLFWMMQNGGASGAIGDLLCLGLVISLTIAILSFVTQPE